MKRDVDNFYTLEWCFMTYSAVTREYYAMWLGVERGLLDNVGVFWVYNNIRNHQPAGYPNALDVYAFITPRVIIVSYGDKASEFIPQIKDKLEIGMPIEEISTVLGEAFLSKVKHNIKYLYTHHKSAEGNPALKLSAHDCDAYLDFFKIANQNCKDISWVREYFLELVAKGYSYGVIKDGRLVSVTDAPDMPFMADLAQEIGINTLPLYQGNGYAKYACLSCVQAMLQAGICPQWSTTANNIASQKLAESIGFEKFFDNLSVTIPCTV
jgi:hypothetical protein